MKKCRMLAVSEPDEMGRRRYECANACCDARALTAHPPEKVHGYSEFCGRPWAMSEEMTGVHPLRLGDRMERWLWAIGITQERYVAFKRMLGFSADCDCDLRKEWLNSVQWLNNLSDHRWWTIKMQPVARLAIKPLKWLP